MSQCPIPTEAGRDCWNTPHPDSSYGLCVEHWQSVADAWSADKTAQHWRCPVCKRNGIQRNRADNRGFCITEGCQVAVPIQDRTPYTPGEILLLRKLYGIGKVRGEVVYYLRFAGRIKIGTSTDLPNRVLSIPHDEVLAVEQGSYAAETDRHAEFADSLIPGHKEWFNPSPALVSHINHLRRENGEPMAAAARWKQEYESKVA